MVCLIGSGVWNRKHRKGEVPMGRQEESGRWDENKVMDTSTVQEGSDIHRGREIWKTVLHDTRVRIPAEDFDKWISDLRFVAEVDDVVLVAARDQLSFDRINSNHRPLLKRIWRKSDPKGRALKIACGKDIPASTRQDESLNGSPPLSGRVNARLPPVLRRAKESPS